MMQREAELFADMAHTQIGQKRKYTFDPYIYHPKNVAYLVKCVGGTDEMVSAAFLHDVLEDVAPICSMFNEEAILKKFGSTVLNYVVWLTDISKPEDGNRENRKKIDRNRIQYAPSEVKTIKIADLIDNAVSICDHDPNFAKIYMQEKRLLLNNLLDGNKELWRIADSILIKHGY